MLEFRVELCCILEAQSSSSNVSFPFLLDVDVVIYSFIDV